MDEINKLNYKLIKFTKTNDSLYIQYINIQVCHIFSQNCHKLLTEFKNGL